MLSKKKLENNKGFTIIEVMIVLAIAGLIMLIVFLAVPALQRNSRNTQRKNDIGVIGTAANAIASNNNGKLSAVNSGLVQTEMGTLAYYTPSTNVTVVDGNTAANLVNGTTKDTVKVVTDAKCGATASADAVLSVRQIAVLYSVESGTGTNKVCVDQ